MKEQIVINGLLVNFYKFGNEGKKALIFLHGWRSNGLIWKEITHQLSQDHLIYALDMPGFGESATPKKPFTVQDYANIVAEFIAKKDLKKVILIGHSFGGRVAIKLSATKPKIIEKVVLVGSAGIILNKKTAQKAIARMIKPLFKPKFMQPVRKKIYEKMGAEDYVATPELKETYLNLINEDLTPHFANINQPTLLVWGDNDQDAPLTIGKIMNEQIKNSKLVVFEDAGHFSFLDEPAKFYQELNQFLGKS
jgi:pimeloyl-ACP methyl ester carboxylesterase